MAENFTNLGERNRHSDAGNLEFTKHEEAKEHTLKHIKIKLSKDKD